MFDDWHGKLQEFKARSRFDPGITVTEYDRVLTLSTCDTGYRNNRIVMHGVLVSETFPHLEGNNDNHHDYHHMDVAG